MMKRFLMLVGMVMTLSVGMAQTSRVEVTRDDYECITLLFSSARIDAHKVALKGETFVQLSMEGMIPSQQEGVASLPTFSTLIEVPLCEDFAVEVSRAVYDTVDMASLGMEGLVAPAQPSRSKSDSSPSALAWDREAYARDAYMGAELALVEEVGIARDRRLARLQISPVRYNAVRGRLIVCRSLELTVRYVGADVDATEALFQRYHSPAFHMGGTLNSLYAKSVSAAPVRYLIVAHSMFRGQLDNLVAWKRRKGFLVDIVYTDNAAVGTSTASIASYLQGQYVNATAATPAPTYVLLVGDHEQIPAFDNQTAASASGTTQHVTDLYYMTWTAGDHIPDCYYGRFSAQTAEQLLPQVQKTLMYEQYTFADPSFLDRAVMVAGVDGGTSNDYGFTHADPAMDYAITHYVNGANGYADIRYFKNDITIVPAGTNVLVDVSNSGNSAAVRNCYNQGAGWINYSAHGSATSWGTPNFSTSHAAAMTNTQKFGLMIGNCCLTNKFETTTCLGEAVLRKGNYCGAVGYIGGSNSTYWNEDFYWAVGLRSNIGPMMSMAYNAANLGNYDRMCHTHGEAHSAWVETQGGLVVNGNAIVEGSTSSASMKHYYWEIYHLMGDPSLMPYHTQTDMIDVVCANVLPAGVSQLAVQAVPYAYVAITDTLTHTLVAAAYADAAGQVLFDLTAPLPVGGYEIAVSAQNRRTTFVPLDIITPDGPFVVAMVDAATPVAGSTHWLSGSVMNLGSSTATNITVHMTCSHPDAMLLTDSVVIPSLAAGDTLVLDSMAAVRLMPLMEDMTYFTISTTTAYDGAIQVSPRPNKMVCHAPKVVVTYNNMPENLMPGDHHMLMVTVVNQGHADLMASAVEMRCPVWHVAIAPSILTPLSLPVGSSATRQFALDVDRHVPLNIMVPIRVDIDAEVNVEQVNMTVPVGAPVKETFEGQTFHLSGWTHNAYPWVATGSDHHGGSCSARSCQTLTHSQSSTMTLTRQVPMDDSISFWYKVSSESGYDKLHFLVDGTEMLLVSGEIDWTRVAYPVTSGTHTFTFTYQKDVSVNSGSDCVWIDDVQLPYVVRAWQTEEDTVCHGEELVLMGDTIDTHQAGSFYVTDTSTTPMLFAHYVILPQLTADTLVYACDSYAWNDTTYTESTLFAELLQEEGQCSVLMTHHLTINHSTLDSIEVEVTDCQYVWNDSIYTASGVYEQILENAAGCDSVVVLTLTLRGATDGIDGQATVRTVKAYPNPTSGMLHLDEQVREVEVCDMLGRRVMWLKDTEKVDLGSLPNGVYMLVLNSADGMVTRTRISLCHQ